MAVGMTLITLSGHIMSFSLGAMAAASAIVFVVSLKSFGFYGAIAAALACGMLINGLLGFFVGSIRSNPIIITIAANVLIYGFATWLTNNETFRIGLEPQVELLNSRYFGVPSNFIVFVVIAAACQLLLSFTPFGRRVYLVGSGIRAAEASGLPVTSVIFFVYALAGLLAAVAGILLACRFHQANMSLASGADYDAIAAVLVGGTAIQGGHGSVLRTVCGAAVLVVLQNVLLLHGFQEEWRYLITGLVVLFVILAYYTPISGSRS